MGKNASINILLEDQVSFPECPISSSKKLTPPSKKKKQNSGL